MTFVPVGIVLVGLAARVVALESRAWPRGYASVAAWSGLFAGAALLGWGPQLGVSGSEIGLAFAMASAASVVALDGVDDTSTVPRGSEYASLLVGAGLAAASLWAGTVLGDSPWRGGALLVAVHWGCLAAALSAGIAGLAAVVESAFAGDAPEEQGDGLAHQFAGRAVGFLWLGWAVAQLVHWRLLGVSGLGSRSEWFGLGAVLVATGCWVMGLPRVGGDDPELRRLGSASVVAAVVVLGLALAFGFGAPLQLSLGS